MVYAYGNIWLMQYCLEFSASLTLVSYCDKTKWYLAYILKRFAHLMYGVLNKAGKSFNL